VNDMRQVTYSSGAATIAGLAALPLDALSAAEAARDAAWLVDGRDEARGQEVIAAIRRHSSPRVYLQPLVLLCSPGQERRVQAAGADAVVLEERLDGTGVDELARRFAEINRWIEALPGVDGIRDEQLPARVLRHLVSRDLSLEPALTTGSSLGFVYPPVQDYAGDDRQSLQEVLEFLEDQYLLSGSFAHRAHFCVHCDCAFLNFEEVCGHCGSADLEVEDLVHHFKCGNIAPMSEYQRNGAMACAKCDRPLQHIGVDYDKPALVYRCSECDHRAQEADTMTTCFSCGRRTAPENQRRRDIKRYRVTGIGENAARYGMENLFTRVLERDVGLVPWPVFERFAAVEQARVERYDRARSALLCLRLQDIDTLYERIGARSGEVFQALGAVFRSVLRRSDVIAARNTSLFVILLTETDQQQAGIARERLLAGIADLLESNLQYRPSIDTRIAPVAADTDAAALAAELMDDDAD